MEHIHVNEGLSRQELLEILKECKLLSAEQLQRIEATDPDSDSQTLAKTLVDSKLVTAYQMDAMLNRRHEKLRIGNYDVLDKLGTGGTGTVFRARHRRMKRVVALKVLSRNLCKDKVFVQRFQREVETIAQLSHPNIVMAYDADEAKVGHFLVMEFVAGQDLASLVEKQGPMSLSEAVGSILQAARGLDYVHGQGMIHRDMKPANLLRDDSGTVKVTDLGLARLSSGSSALANNTLTQAGGVLGTVDYMSPEQALDSTNLDHRSDIYSLGATLYYLLVGKPVYPGQTMMDTLLKHRDAPIPSLKAARQDVPDALDDLFRRMMAKSVQDRVQTMAEAAQILEAIQATLGDTSAAPAAALSPAGSNAFGQLAADESPRQPRETISVPRAVSDHTMDLPSFGAAVNASLNVLLVEPSRTQASIIRKFLQSQNIQQVAVVTCGHEALKAVQGDRPNVIISAMFLADMTGVQLVQQIRASGTDQPPGFVLLSSESESVEAGTLSKCGQAVLLQKPFTPEKLIDALSVVSGQVLAALPTSPEQLGVSLVQPLMLGLKPRDSAAARYSKLRVLIVDDSKPARVHIRNVLTGMGLTQFSEVADGAQAVACLARDSFDLIITDYNMPLMDGRSLIGYLKQNPVTSNVPVIMVTTETKPEKLAAVRDLGVTAICEKSFPAEVVRGVIEQIGSAP